MEVKILQGDDLKKILAGAVAKLEEDKGIVDALNVFPVPDGDTGTNMYYTLLSAHREVSKIKSRPSSASEVADAAALGALMGARGNSGVILSQLLRGFASGVKGKTILNAHDLEVAFKTAVDTAYKAVMRPVEGTILTVVREAAQAGIERIKTGTTDILDILEYSLQEGEASLKRTPEKLLILREAGVVDAGGKGLMVAALGGLNALQKRSPYEKVKEVKPSVETKAHSPISTADLEYRYCTEFIIKPKEADINIDKVREDLTPRGDSLLVVGSPDLIRVHVHTNNPGVILEYGLLLGDIDQIKIDNMAEQTEEFFKEKKPLGIIAVAAGEGFKEILTSLGVDVIIEGGQTMNPSTASFIKAIEKVNAEKVILLPNNSNVILTAEQVKALTSVQVEVVPSKTVVQGISALMAFDDTLDIQENLQAMTNSIKNVKSGEVTYAVRDWNANGSNVKKGDYIGLHGSELKSFGSDREEILIKLLKEMLAPEDEIITIYFGSDITEEEAEIVKEKLQAEVEEDEIALEFYYGGQPLYFYIVGIE